MKKVMLVILVVIVAACVALAQPAQAPQGTADVLGAHNVYGRGCVACHAPHSGSAGNGVVGGSPGNLALWGQDLTPLYGKTLGFGDGGTVTVTLPTAATMPATAHDPSFVIIACLSCHDGNVAKPGMMKGTTVETLPVVGGHAPTFLGNDGSGAGNYTNDHPVGPNAILSCGPPYDWDCTIDATGHVVWGPQSTQFGLNYGHTVSFSIVNNQPTVTCTSCHDQHSQNIYSGKIGNVQGFYPTAFFVKGYYNPNAGGNSVAQFCRNCHGGESNEAHGQTGVPTI